MNNKAKYSEFCERYYVPLMLRPFWLDAVCNENGWNVVLATNQGGEVMGSLVYHLASYRGFPIIKMPPLTDYSGLWLHYRDNLEKKSSRYSFEKEVCNNLISQLPKTAFFYQQWHPAVTNWLPFFWQDFRQTTLYTYRLDLKSESLLWENFNKTIRKNLRNLQSLLTVETVEEVDTLYALVQLTFARKGLEPPYSLDTLRKLDAALQKKSLRRIYLARNQSGQYCAGIYLVWDEQCAYSLISAADPQFRQLRATSLLQWQTLLDSIGKVSTFDLCGSILEPIEESLRAFGGELTPHYKITKPRNKFFYLLGILLNKDV